MTEDRHERATGPEVREVLGGSVYRRLFEAVRTRIEQAGDQARTATLRDLNAPERKAIADLHGWKTLPEGTVRIRLEKLDQVLRQSRFGIGLREVLEILGGPLTDRRALRLEVETARERFWEEANSHTAVLASPELGDWLHDLRALGLLTRAAGASGLDPASILSSALDLLAQLPAQGVLLPVLAAEITGDAHALDPGRPLTGIVLRGVAALIGRSEQPSSSLERRRLWEAVGVLCDPLSSHVLVLGLIPTGASRLPRSLRAASQSGEPQIITLRELVGSPLAVRDGTCVSVCENPAVVATAADRLSGNCAPLICTEGVPSTAVWALLEGLARHGALIRFHCDFDWGGIRIGNQITSRLAAVPWRFTARNYSMDILRDLDYPPLTGPPVPASWDPNLSAHMQQTGRAILEEHVIDALLEDLRGTKE